MNVKQRHISRHPPMEYYYRWPRKLRREVFFTRTSASPPRRRITHRVRDISTIMTPGFLLKQGGFSEGRDGVGDVRRLLRVFEDCFFPQLFFFIVSVTVREAARVWV